MECGVVLGVNNGKYSAASKLFYGRKRNIAAQSSSVRQVIVNPVNHSELPWNRWKIPEKPSIENGNKTDQVFCFV